MTADNKILMKWLIDKKYGDTKHIVHAERNNGSGNHFTVHFILIWHSTGYNKLFEQLKDGLLP